MARRPTARSRCRRWGRQRSFVDVPKLGDVVAVSIPSVGPGAGRRPGVAGARIEPAGGGSEIGPARRHWFGCSMSTPGRTRCKRTRSASIVGTTAVDGSDPVGDGFRSVSGGPVLDRPEVRPHPLTRDVDWQSVSTGERFSPRRRGFMPVVSKGGADACRHLPTARQGRVLGQCRS